jgi:hypothetical protein
MLYYLPQFRTTTLSVPGGINSSQTTGIILASIPSDLDIAKPGVICITYTNPLNTTNAEFITYTSIDGSNTLVGATRGAEGYSAKAHSNGATIAWVVSKSHVNNLNDKLTSRDAVLCEDPNGNEIVKSAYVASAVNELTLSNAATGNKPSAVATGGDTNIGLDVSSKGTGALTLWTGNKGREGLIIANTASAVNEVTVTQAATGSAPQIGATGDDTNIDLALVGKGTGGVTTKGKKRVTTITSSATPTVNTDNCDVVTITALAAAITSMTTNLSGTPANFQPLIYRIKDDGTSRAITWGASFANRGATMPTATTANKVHHVGFLWNSVTNTWDCVAALVES